jgi:hypothetical protein
MEFNYIEVYINGNGDIKLTNGERLDVNFITSYLTNINNDSDELRKGTGKLEFK